MTPERAHQIVSAINDRCMFTMDLCENPGSLVGVSLAEMLEAKEFVERRNRDAESVVAFFFKQWGEWREVMAGEFCNTLRGRAGKPPAFIMEANGNVHCTSFTAGMDHAMAVIRVGKKAAGRILDGTEWSQFPKTEPTSVIEGSAPQQSLSSPDPENREAS